MREKVKQLFQGIILGISFIIPGVSGGTLAVVLGIYQNLIEAASHIFESFKNFKKYFCYLLPLGIGALFAIILFSNVIQYSLSKIPVITILLFVGLIVGGLPGLFKNVKKKPNWKDLVCLSIGVLVLVLLSTIGENGKEVVLSNNLFDMFKLFAIGILAAGTMVIPGISGSFLLMSVGYYEPILKVVTELTKFNNVYENVLIMIPFGIGVIAGIVVIAKLIEFCFRKNEVRTYYVIFGFVIASLFDVFLSVFSYSFTWVEMTIGFVVMVLSALFVYKVFEK